MALPKARKCEICGQEFAPRTWNQKVCSEECRQFNTQIYMSEYRRDPKWRKYNKEWMRKYRETHKSGKAATGKTAAEIRAEVSKKRDRIKGEGYAERQMAMTLAKAGKVEI